VFYAFYSFGELRKSKGESPFKKKDKEKKAFSNAKRSINVG
jgi:hypothetical protein